ncbi:hypothetical protein P3T36_004496 [Kitasatospora sp. MAP12-15]|uniref:SflA family class IV lanthipeptide n=1 Tax=unclassified Kitasatospora TaxID=2633591 RepID=UPI002474D89E|nr:SflA family class IV lanthipeptide [Kitasatospora sp. MAP12-44]MDH6110923.1 hypothetical protein [Kitasatospora sp. MAP12-44]
MSALASDIRDAGPLVVEDELIEFEEEFDAPQACIYNHVTFTPFLTEVWTCAGNS